MCLVVVSVVLSLSSVGAQVPWHSDYEEGLEALDSQDYTSAIDSLVVALESNATPASRVKLYGTRYFPYYPWFYLGKALYERADADGVNAMEDLEKSVEAFDMSLDYGAIRNEAALTAELEALRENAATQISLLLQRDEAMTYVAAGRRQFDSGELQMAYEEFLKAAALLRDDEEVQSLLTMTRGAIDERWRRDLIAQGRRSLDEDDPEQARKLGQEVLGRFPRDADADSLLLAVTRYQAEQIEQQLRLEAERERNQIREREARLNNLSEAQAALASGRFDDARRLNSRVLEYDPGDEEARQLAVRIVAAEIAHREDEQAEELFRIGRALHTEEEWLEAIRTLSQIKETHYRASEAAALIESAERGLNRILVTFDAPAENERIRGEEVSVRGRVVASAGIRSVSVTVNGEAAHPIFVVGAGADAPDSLELNETIELGEGRNVLVLQAEDTLGRREALSARTVNVVLPFHRRPLPLAVTSLSLLLIGVGIYSIIKYRREAAMRKDVEKLEVAVRARTEELMAAQHQLIQSEKMATLGRLAASVAHEINSPLGVITSNKHIYESVWKRLSKESESGDAKRAMKVFHSTLDNDRVAIGRIERQVTNLRRFASLDEAELKRITIDEIVDTALTMLEDLIASRGAEVSRITPSHPTRGLYPAGSLIHVFHGLLEFCLQQMAPRETVSIDTASTTVEIETSFEEPLAEPVDTVFEPHFRKVSGRIGAEMSLALSRHLVQEQGGQVGLECVDRNANRYRFVVELRAAT